MHDLLRCPHELNVGAFYVGRRIAPIGGDEYDLNEPVSAPPLPGAHGRTPIAAAYELAERPPLPSCDSFCRCLKLPPALVPRRFDARSRFLERSLSACARPSFVAFQ